MMTDDAVLEVAQADLSPYRRGNTGVDYVHRFDSGRPGPELLINALTHGNEICGMVAVKRLLDTGFRPKIGTLTLSFANVDAYEAFDPARPWDNRQLVHNFNRIWSPAWLAGGEDSPELRRAREMRPIVDAADQLLDIHSTRTDVPPFWVYPAFDRNAAVAEAIGEPAIHLVMPLGRGPAGATLMQYGRFGDPAAPGAGLVVECGGHFKRAAADLAVRVSMDFLAHFGLADPRPDRMPPPAARRFELLETHVVKSADFRFTRALAGFEVFAKDELVAMNGDEPIRAPCADCTIFMPTHEPIVGREAVYLTRPH